MAFLFRAISGSERNQTRLKDTDTARTAFQLELDNIRRRLEAEDEDDLHSILEIIYDSRFPESQKFLKEPTKERLKAHTDTVCRLLSGLSSLDVPVTQLLLQVVTKYGTDSVSEPLMTLLEMVRPLLANKDIPDFTSDDLLDAIDNQWHSGSVRSSPVWGTASSRTQSPAHSASTAVSPRSPAFRKAISSLSVPIAKVEGNNYSSLAASSPTNFAPETPPTPPILQSLSDKNLTPYSRRSLAWILGTEGGSQPNEQSVNAEPRERINAAGLIPEVLQSPEDEEKHGLGHTLSLPNSTNGGVKLLPRLDESEEQEESTEIPVIVPKVDASNLASSLPHFSPLDTAGLATSDDGEVHEAKQEESFSQDFTAIKGDGGLEPEEYTKMSQALEEPEIAPMTVSLGPEEELENYGQPSPGSRNLRAANEVSSAPHGMVSDEPRSLQRAVQSEVIEGEPNQPNFSTVESVPVSISGQETNLEGTVSDTSSQGSDANAKSSKELSPLSEEPSSSSEESSSNLDELISTPYEPSSNSEESSPSLDESISTSYKSSSHLEESSSNLDSTSGLKATQETAMTSEGSFEVPATVVSPTDNWEYELHNVPLNLMPTIDVEKDRDHLVPSKILPAICSSEDGNLLPVISADSSAFCDVTPEFNNQLDLPNGEETLQNVNAVDTENGEAHIDMEFETFPVSGVHDAVDHTAEVLNNGSKSQPKPSNAEELVTQLNGRFGTDENSCKGLEQGQELHDSTSVKDEADEDNPLHESTISPEQTQNHFEDSADIMSPFVEEVSKQEASVNGTESTAIENIPEVEMEIAGVERSSTTSKNFDVRERARKDEIQPSFSSEDLKPAVSLQTVNAEQLLSSMSSGQEPGAGANEAMVFPTDDGDRGFLSPLHSGEYQQTDENNNISQGVKDGDGLLPSAYFLPVQGASGGKRGTPNVRRLNEVVVNNSTVKADDHNMSKGDMQKRNGFLQRSSTTPPHLQEGQHHMESNTGHVIIASIDDIMDNVQAKPVEYDPPGVAKVGLEVPLAEWQGDNLLDKNNLTTLLSPDSVFPQYDTFAVDQCKYAGENEQPLQQATAMREDHSNESDTEVVHMSVPQRNLDDLVENRETCEQGSPVTHDNLNDSKEKPWSFQYTLSPVATDLDRSGNTSNAHKEDSFPTNRILDMHMEDQEDNLALKTLEQEHDEDAVMPQVDMLEKQEIESKGQDDEGSSRIQPPGSKTDLETAKVLDVASEPGSILGGAQEADQQAEDAVVRQVDVLEKQDVEPKGQEDEGSRAIQPPGSKTDLETAEVLDVASEPGSILGGAQEADQQAEDAVMPQLDALEKQDIKPKGQDDEGSRIIQPPGSKTDLETAEVLDVASEPGSILGGAQEADQQAEDAVMPQLDALEKQDIKPKGQEDEGSRAIQPPGSKTDLETTKVLNVASEPASILGGPQETDQQAEDAVMPQVDMLETQDIETEVQEDEGSRAIQPPGSKTDLETTKVPDVASEPVSILGGPQEADQQAEDAVMPQVEILEEQQVKSKVQEDEGRKGIQPPGRKTDLETTKPVSILGGAQEVDQHAEDAVVPQVDFLEKQNVELKVQEDEGSRGFQPPGRKTDLETTKVLDVACEPVSTSGGAPEADQQAEDAVVPQVDVLEKQDVESKVQEDEGSRGFKPPGRKTDLKTTKVLDVASEPGSILGGAQKADQQTEESSSNSQPTVSMSSSQEDKEVQGLLAPKPTKQDMANLHSTPLNGRGEPVQNKTKTIPFSERIFAKSSPGVETFNANYQAEMPSISGKEVSDQSGFQKPLKSSEMTLINVASSAIAPDAISLNQSSPRPSTGNISCRSDSSTASVHSFAFPILSNEYNVSPKKMTVPDRRHSVQQKQKWRRWCCCCFCPSTL